MYIIVDKDILEKELLSMVGKKDNLLNTLSKFLNEESINFYIPRYSKDELLKIYSRNNFKIVKEDVSVSETLYNELQLGLSRFNIDASINEIKEYQPLSESFYETLPNYIKYNFTEFSFLFYWRSILSLNHSASTVYISNAYPTMIENLEAPFNYYSSFSEFIKKGVSKTLFFNQDWFNNNIHIGLFDDINLYDTEDLQSDIRENLCERLGDAIHFSYDEISYMIKDVEIDSIMPSSDILFENCNLVFGENYKLFLECKIEIDVSYSVLRNPNVSDTEDDEEDSEEDENDEDALVDEIFESDSYDKVTTVYLEINENGVISTK